MAKENPLFFVSGGDDKLVNIYDIRVKFPVSSLVSSFQITSVEMNKEGNEVFSAGIDGIIRKYDLRNESEPIEVLSLPGHRDIITGISLSPDNSFLLSNSMDNYLAHWDLRPFISGGNSHSNRCIKTYEGFKHGAEKVLLKCSWSFDQTMVSCGSADR